MKTLITMLFLALAACATTPPVELTKAHEAYDRASTGPARTLAPAELYQAQKLLSAADRSYEDLGDDAQTRDWAYIALRKSELAETRARAAGQYFCAAADRKAAAAELVRLHEEMVAQAQAAREAEAARQKNLAELPPEVEVKKDARGTVITLPGSVLFETGKAALSDSAKRHLAKVAKALETGNSEQHITIEGHTDSTGSAEQNEALSLARAASVEDYLVSEGVPKDRIETKGYGETRPIADNSTPESRAANRRVEIVIHAPVPVG